MLLLETQKKILEFPIFELDYKIKISALSRLFKRLCAFWYQVSHIDANQLNSGFFHNNTNLHTLDIGGPEEYMSRSGLISIAISAVLNLIINRCFSTKATSTNNWEKPSIVDSLWSSNFTSCDVQTALYIFNSNKEIKDAVTYSNDNSLRCTTCFS